MPHSVDGTDKEAGANHPRRSALGRLWRGTWWVISSPFSVFPIGSVVKNARLIGELASHIGIPASRDARLHLSADHVIDLEATAFAYGISVPALEEKFQRRRRETAQAAYLAFLLGWFFFLLWLRRIVEGPFSGAHLIPEIEFMPFCTAFFLMAFRSALQNYQARTRSLATAAEFLCTTRGFWPS